MMPTDSNREPTLNEFLNEINTAARELTHTIRGSVNKVVSQSMKGAINTTGVYPLLDVYETPDTVVIRTSPLESRPPAKIEVSMNGDQLTLKILTQTDETIPDETYLLRERRFGEFLRTVQIPRPVDATKAQAKFKEGILTITLPKLQSEAPLTIPVEN